MIGINTTANTHSIRFNGSLNRIKVSDGPWIV